MRENGWREEKESAAPLIDPDAAEYMLVAISGGESDSENEKRLQSQSIAVGDNDDEEYGDVESVVDNAQGPLGNLEQ